MRILGGIYCPGIILNCVLRGLLKCLRLLFRELETCEISYILLIFAKICAAWIFAKHSRLDTYKTYCYEARRHEKIIYQGITEGMGRGSPSKELDCNLGRNTVFITSFTA